MVCDWRFEFGVSYLVFGVLYFVGFGGQQSVGVCFGK